ncbi:MAG TPA: LacI family DNA-binding transcriptional regulator [Candidatus Omnitrophota bacterium]|nr:LacI family DNA-binding transcriptional regulator [Candidatus Omnitrophota bacterium]HOX09779.1 LacI family DNA-binding transcriptional regulator [Candidatus Omnitrophota bacterium]HPN66043.1 LacI family DNA-binding transcriptional regulator [Candidatus Omnitrophota bacterium]HRZ67558.1 LacI family DNA-binding transcriptional regulator [Candidatus Omnitrophota bacterium]
MKRFEKSSITIKDIAKKAGVAHSTVSLVMNDREHVSPKLREKILKIANDMGYMPNMVARSLISKKSSTVGVVFPENPHFFTITYFLMIIEGIQNACKKYNRALMFFSLDQTKGESYYQISRKWLIDLMIIMNVDYTRDISKDIQDLRDNGIYFSFLTKYLGKEKVNSVCVDNYEGVRLALEYLASQGHKRVGFIAGNPNSADGPERFQAYKSLSKKFGFDQDEELIAQGDFTFESGEREMPKLLALKKRPSVVFAASDYMAIGAMRVIKEQGLSIPKDIAVMGFDNTLEAAYVEPGLTTVRQPLQEMGEKAVDLAIRSMNDENFEPQTLAIKPELIKRQSC